MFWLNGSIPASLLVIVSLMVKLFPRTSSRKRKTSSLPTARQTDLAFRAYCQQQDTHVGESTVHEALMFSALLRQPSSVPFAEKAA